MEMADLVENLCGIISVLMLRDGVDKLVIKDTELLAMRIVNFGKALSFAGGNGEMVVTVDDSVGKLPSGSVEINEMIDSLRGG